MPVGVGFDLATLRAWVGDRDKNQAELAAVTQQSSEVSSLLSRLEQTSAGSPDAEIAALERDATTIGSEYETWLNDQGAQITQLLDALREFHSELTPLDGASLDDQVRDALSWCILEVDRCRRLLDQHSAASQQLVAARTTIQRATTRINEINQDLEAGAEDARTLAAALAGIAPHIEGDLCPVCKRDYAELGSGSLTAHIAATIANLTSEAGRLQALSTERASESERLTTARRDEATKGLGKQVVIAVHERALFEYLTLELSPAFAGDSLITVEISRNFAGDAVADPHFYVFEDDKAVAA